MSGLSLTGWSALLSIAIYSVSTLLENCAIAQITPDETLPINSRIQRNGETFNINGGTTSGSNLFHSFREFSILANTVAVFNNASNIQNIISRVTGGSKSEIDGSISSNVGSTANLFLINPSGIIFGQNASLNIGGSFVATTANAIAFGDRGIFSATNPQAPPLLTIQPSALWFNQLNQNAEIQNNSVAPAGIDPAGLNALGLRVPDGKSLLLVGGNVTMNRGRLNAYGGRVELGGLAIPGNVNLLFNGDNLSLKFPENVTRASVFTNQAGVYVPSAGGGNIAINAQNLEILGGSILSAGIGVGLGTPETIAGDITLNAIGEIKIAGSATDIRNLVRSGSKGKGGNITIDSGDFSLRDSAQLTASTYGQGNGGNVTVSAKNAVSLANVASILSTVEPGGVGTSGNININAATLSLTDGAQLTASTYGQGNGGNVTVSAKNAVSLANVASILSTVEPGGVGTSGNIDINAATLSLTDGAQLLTITRGASNTQPAGRGDAGNVNINVTGAVDIAGQKIVFQSGIFSSVQTGTVGNGGNITINSGDFSLRDAAQLSASTFGQGNGGNVTVGAKNAVSFARASILSTVEPGGVGKGGNIDINATTLSLTDGAQLSASTFGQGNGGNVTVGAKNTVSLADAAYIFSTVETGGVGKGGNIDINATTLSLTDGAQLLTFTRGASDTQPAGRGDAGNVNVNVTGAVDIAGQKNGFTSGIFSSVQTGTVGNGGNITIDSGSFSLQNGTQLVASTSGEGNAGKITVNATDKVIISGIDPSYSDRISKFPDNVLNIGANSGLFVSSTGSGITGDIEINSPKVTLDNQGKLNAESASGNGGNINLNSDLLLLRRNSQISTSAGTDLAGGNGGNITINAPNGFIAAVPNENSDITANAFNGQGGKVKITATKIFGLESRSRQQLEQSLGTTEPEKLDPKDLQTSDITAISQTNPELSGIVELNTPDVDPSRGLVQLPINLVDASQQIDTGCNVGGKQRKSSFVVTGRRLPPQPGEALRTEAVIVNGVEVGEENRSASGNFTPESTSGIVEAQGWVVNSLGEILLTAYPTSVTPSQNFRSIAATCHAS